MAGSMKYLECPVCRFRTSLHFRIDHHIKIHNLPQKESLFDCANPIESLKCHRCGNFETHRLAQLQHHLEAGHALSELQEAPYQCRNCSFRTHSRCLYLSHKLFNQCIKSVKVPVSEEASESRLGSRAEGDTLLVHTDPDRVRWFKCQQCSYESRTKDYLKKHMGRMHCTNIKKFKCDHCQFETKLRKSLKNHVVLKHTNSDKIQWFECKECSFKAKIKPYLDTHVNYTHGKPRKKRTNTPKVKCHHCQYETRHQHVLKRHILEKHTEPSSIPWSRCEHCPYQSKTKINLKHHVDNKHVDREKFKCAHCQYESKTKYALKRHILRRHADSESIQWFECEICPHRYKTKSDLKRHAELVHSERENLTCEHCRFKTKYKFNLKLHNSRKHEDPANVRWFYCVHCCYKTPTECALKNHTKGHQRQFERSKNQVE